LSHTRWSRLIQYNTVPCILLRAGPAAAAAASRRDDDDEEDNEDDDEDEAEDEDDDDATDDDDDDGVLPSPRPAAGMMPSPAMRRGRHDSVGAKE
jgi:hypothetical protein